MTSIHFFVKKEKILKNMITITQYFWAYLNFDFKLVKWTDVLYQHSHHEFILDILKNNKQCQWLAAIDFNRLPIRPWRFAKKNAFWSKLLYTLQPSDPDAKY